MKLTTTLYIHQSQYAWEDTPEYLVFSHKMDDTDYRTFVCEQEVEIEVPDDFDPRAQKIAALERYKQKITAEFQKAVTDINRRISELQAITHTA